MTNTAARLSSALAMHMSCLCPTDKLSPPGDTVVGTPTRTKNKQKGGVESEREQAGRVEDEAEGGRAGRAGAGRRG